jgi:PAS domain S-box-containing protein
MDAKAELIREIEVTMRRRGLAAEEAARLCGTDGATLSSALAGGAASVTADLLLAWLGGLGRRVRLVVEPEPGEAEALGEGERLRLAREALGMGLFDWDVARGVLSWSDEVFRMHGLEPGSVTPSPELWLRTVHPDDRPHVERVAADFMAGGSPDFDYRVVWPDGGVHHAAARARTVRDAAGRAARVSGVVIDLTDLKRAEAALRESEQRLRATHESVNIAIVESDAEGRVLRVNEAATVMTGAPREALLGRRFLDFTLPDDREVEGGPYRRLVAGEVDSYLVEKRYLHVDGRTLWASATGSAVRDDRGRFLYGVRVLQDITPRKEAEARQALLIAELNHRVKNTLATVQSLARHTLRAAPDPEAFRRGFQARLAALSTAHGLLTRTNWSGADLREVLAQELAPHDAAFPGLASRDGAPPDLAPRDGPAASRVSLVGDPVNLSPRAALALGMTFHELATNAAKYGALSTPAGRVEVRWAVRADGAGRRLVLDWAERGGPAVAPPERQGFGSRLIERGVAHDLGGAVEVDFRPDGLRCRLEVPVGDAASAGAVPDEPTDLLGVGR